MNNYPNRKVIAGYTLLGGLTGSGILAILVQAIEITKAGYLIPLTEVIIFIFFGTIVGTVPAVITGIIISLTKTYLNNIKDVIKCFLLGFLVTFVCYYLPMAVIFLGFTDWSLFFEPMFMSLLVVGGVSSVVLAFLFLPKGERNE